MRLADVVLLLAAGVGAGLTSSIAGLASLVSYPALLATGLPPVPANVTNAVGLVFQGLATAHGSTGELRAARPRQLVRRLVGWAVAGGITGSVLLLATSSDTFALIAPWLIGVASIGVLVPGRQPAVLGAEPAREGWVLQAGTFAVSVYGGYFGAGAGVMLTALLMASTGESLARSSAVRTVLLIAANGVAAIGFALFGPVDWVAVLPLTIGLVVGGRIGPVVLRNVPAGPLRVLIALTGLGLALHLGGVRF